MANVVKLCPASRAELRWPEEYRDDEFAVAEEKTTRDKSMAVYHIYRAATMVAVGSAGIGMTFLCIGICMMHWPTILMGVVMTAVFAVGSYIFDGWADKELDHVCGS